jgi:hypothetical protein
MNQICIQYVFGRKIEASVNAIAWRLGGHTCGAGVLENRGKQKGEFHEQESDER